MVKSKHLRGYSEMKTYQDFKISGDGESKSISKEEFLEIFQEAIRSQNDTTMFGYIGADGWIVLYQGTKEMRFREETLRNLADFSSSIVSGKEGNKP